MSIGCIYAVTIVTTEAAVQGASTSINVEARLNAHANLQSLAPDCCHAA